MQLNWLSAHAVVSVLLCLGVLSGAVWLLGVSTHAMCELCAPGAAVGSAVWRVKLVDVHVAPWSLERKSAE